MSKKFDESELRCYNKQGELIDPATNFRAVYYIYVGTLEAVEYIQELDNALNVNAVGYWAWKQYRFVSAENEIKTLNERYAPFNLTFRF